MQLKGLMIMDKANRIIEVDTSDPAKIVFHFLNYWEQLKDEDLNKLKQLSVVETMVAEDCVYLVLEKYEPEKSRCRYSYKLVKFCITDGKAVIRCTDISASEAASVYKLCKTEGVKM